MTAATTSVRVLIVDDSPVARAVLKNVLESDADIRVVGMAATGYEAVEMTATLRPDVVTMDLVMPGMDGMKATEEIMAHHPTPILFLSAFIGSEGICTRSEVLAAGALDVVEKPSTMPDPQWESEADALVQKVKSLARVPVVTHMRRRRTSDRSRPIAESRRATHVVVIGASTGGPKVLEDILASLPAAYGPAVLVIQHMADAFIDQMVATLRRRCALSVKIAETGDRLLPGNVLIAPPAAHLTVLPGSRVLIDAGPPVRGFRPSIDVTFAAVARIYGSRACGVLLTGMGADGASGLLAIRDAGGTTLVQDEASCAVFGMPRAAIELGAAQHVLSPAGLTRHLVSLQMLRRVQE
ncbi:MAG TPA: chemotaxis-specific protein-glutamate methyltransferase CheB [Vicinamibacterales bacterium]|nr:chemotaxis-specific protein-glutamate methyltransferase CheB [Vicinamibacterales bacterium]